MLHGISVLVRSLPTLKIDYAHYRVSCVYFYPRAIALCVVTRFKIQGQYSRKRRAYSIHNTLCLCITNKPHRIGLKQIKSPLPIPLKNCISLFREFSLKTESTQKHPFYHFTAVHSLTVSLYYSLIHSYGIYM